MSALVGITSPYVQPKKDPAAAPPVTGNATGTWRSPTAAPGATGVPGAVGGGAPGQVSTGATGTQNSNQLGAVGEALGSIPIIGGALSNFTSPSTADLSGVHSAQNAAFGLAQNVGNERQTFIPQAAPQQATTVLDTGAADQTRARQTAALDALTGAANGTVPSAAEIAARAAAGRAAASNLGQARALGGRSAGGVARAATLANTDLAARTNADLMANRANEQAVARNQLVDALGGVRNQDIGQATTQANLTQQGAGNNLNATLQTNNQNQDWRKALLDAQLQAYGIGTNAAVGGANASAKNAEAQNQYKGGIVSGIGSAFGL